jgi:tRNA dimethylallyltransferase
MSSSVALDGDDRGAAGAAALTTIPIICGPTASGKSAIAMWLSLRRELLIISADSRQIYREFDVGTAKPSREEQERVPHRGIDVAAPTERYSAAQWADVARRAIEEAHATSRLPLVIGGTGFYIASLFRPLWAEPALDGAHRMRLQRAFADVPTSELRRWCEALDPTRAHLGRAQLLRAIEVALLTGQRLSDLHVVHARPALYRPSYLLVDPGTDLSARIAARASAMLDAGWVDEVQKLMRGVPPDAPAWNATGYAAVREYALGAADRAATLERVVIETRQYAKRQRTWFRHQLDRERVLRLAMGANGGGWQETVDRWITEVERTMRGSAEAAERAR